MTRGFCAHSVSGAVVVPSLFTPRKPFPSIQLSVGGDAEALEIHGRLFKYCWAAGGAGHSRRTPRIPRSPVVCLRAARGQHAEEEGGREDMVSQARKELEQ